MDNDFNPLQSQRDAADFIRTLGHLNNQQRQNALLEEQVRLQREANELKKKELAIEMEKIKLGQGQQTHNKTRQEALEDLKKIAQKRRKIVNSGCYQCHGTLLATCTRCDGAGIMKYCGGGECNHCKGIGRVICTSCCDRD